jgi:hypothetical protein
MGDAETPHPLLKNPLFVFSLPEEILNTLTLKEDAEPQMRHVIEDAVLENSLTGGTGCLSCNIGAFANVSQQREHVRSDLHKFNLKRKLAGQPVVNADEFEKMLDGIPLTTLLI